MWAKSGLGLKNGVHCTLSVCLESVRRHVESPETLRCRDDGSKQADSVLLITSQSLLRVKYGRGETVRCRRGRGLFRTAAKFQKLGDRVRRPPAGFHFAGQIRRRFPVFCSAALSGKNYTDFAGAFTGPDCPSTDSGVCWWCVAGSGFRLRPYPTLFINSPLPSTC